MTSSTGIDQLDCQKKKKKNLNNELINFLNLSKLNLTPKAHINLS